MANDITENDGMNIETLKINIDVSSEKSRSDVENFEKVISRLEQSLKKLNKMLSSSESSLYKLGNQAKKIPNISVYNANSSSNRKNTPESIMSKIDKEKIAARNKKDAELAEIFNQPIAEKSLSLGRWGEGDFAEAAKNAKFISDSTDSARRNIEKYSEELGDIVNTYTVIDGEVTKIDSKIKKSENSSTRMNKIWKSIGHVLKYRLISTAFNLISQGLTEGVKNAALFDDRINESISSIIGSSKQLINQIGAAGGELIVLFEPVIVRLIEWLTIGADKATQFFAALNGKDTYDKAVIQAHDFAKNIRGAFSGIGIDELNIFGSGSNGGLLSDVQYVEESLDGWAQGISDFRKEMQPTVDWINENLDSVLITAISIGTTIKAIKFADSFKDSLNKDLSTSLVTGSKNLLDNLQTIAAIGTITLGISFLNDENKSNDLLGSFLLALGVGLGLTKAAIALFGVSTGAALFVAIPVAVTFFLFSAFDLETPGKLAADATAIDKTKMLAASNRYDYLSLPADAPTTDIISKYYPNQYEAGGDTPFYSFADVINSSRNAEEQNSEKQDEIIYYLSQIASKNTNVILADDDIGRAADRYYETRGFPIMGGDYINAH